MFLTEPTNVLIEELNTEALIQRCHVVQVCRFKGVTGVRTDLVSSRQTTDDSASDHTRSAQIRCRNHPVHNARPVDAVAFSVKVKNMEIDWTVRWVGHDEVFIDAVVGVNMLEAVVQQSFNQPG